MPQFIGDMLRLALLCGAWVIALLVVGGWVLLAWRIVNKLRGRPDPLAPRSPEPPTYQPPTYQPRKIGPRGPDGTVRFTYYEIRQLARLLYYRRIREQLEQPHELLPDDDDKKEGPHGGRR